MDCRLSVQDLSFSYGSTSILKGISFETGGGSLCALLGPNGSGKTTLLKCICGILTMGSGAVAIGGENTAVMNRSRRSAVIAMVPQQVHVLFPYTVLQMILMARVGQYGRMWTPGTRDHAEAMRILAEVNIPHLGHRVFNELSGGEQQMVLLARALYQEPRVLLLDEPTSHLDFRNQYAVMDRIAGITREKGIISLISMHDPNLAARYCRRMILLRSGSVVGQGGREDVFNAEFLGRLYGLSLTIERTTGGHRIVFPMEETM